MLIIRMENLKESLTNISLKNIRCHLTNIKLAISLKAIILFNELFIVTHIHCERAQVGLVLN